MKKFAFEMKLYPGNQTEYKKRHDQIWPELVDLLKSVGISEYSIFLNEASDTLFGVLTIIDETKIEDLPKYEVMQKWWAHMKDIMYTKENNAPISTPLEQVFFMP